MNFLRQQITREPLQLKTTNMARFNDWLARSLTTTRHVTTAQHI